MGDAVIVRGLAGAGRGRPRRPGSYRLTATDIDWGVGAGVEVRGHIGAQLLVLTGRSSEALTTLPGPGARAIRAQHHLASG